MIPTSLQVNHSAKEEKWVQMIALSFAFHLAVFFGSLVVSKNTIYYPSFEEHVYHVELVGAPPPNMGGGVEAAPMDTRKGTIHIVKNKSRRIQGKTKSPPTVIAKRVAPEPSLQVTKKKDSASELIDGAISRAEREVEQEGNQLEEAISNIEKRLERKKTDQTEEVAEQAQGAGAPTRTRSGGVPRGYSGIGTGIQLYQLQIEARIKGNWSYPVALADSREGKGPEAVIELTVRSDGKILQAEFKKRSWDPLFNDSVLKALERSDPLPGFPPGYKKSSDEVEIRFSLKDLIR
jgi:colicin import membrane protein